MVMFRLLRRMAGDEAGATAIEYGLIVSLVVIAIIASMSQVANENTGVWARITDKTDVAFNPPGA